MKIQKIEQKITCNNNLAKVLVNLEEYNRVLHHTDIVLGDDSKNFKAWHRKCEAYIGLKNLIEAQKAFKMVYECAQDKSQPELVNLLHKLKDLKTHLMIPPVQL